MKIKALDHLILTVRSLDETLAFYVDVLGMVHETFGEGRHALKFGHQKINLHVAGAEFDPRADQPMPGSSDLCFLVDSLAISLVTLGARGVEIIEAPVERIGARGRLTSVYIRDPDGNLIELSEEVA